MATPKQKKAFDKLSENVRTEKPKPMGEILKEAGYSVEISKKPSIVVRSKGFRELLDEYIPDSLLAERHLELLNKKERIVSKAKDGTTDVEWTDEPDTQAVKAALDMAYKLKGAYAPDKSVNVNIETQINEKQASELARQLNELYRPGRSGCDGATADPLDQETQHQE